MGPKTERLELRLDANTIERIDEWRDRQHDMPTRSEALRRLIESGLEDHTPEGFRLTNSEKLMTWLLAEILKNQLTVRKERSSTKHDMETVDLIQQAIFRGHFWALPWELPGILHDHVDNPKAVRAVVDILDMWSFIERAHAIFDKKTKKRIEDEVGPRGKNPQFLGFDGNNESEYMGIAQFLVENLGRFESFKGRDFNSHLPTVSRYREMAYKFDSIRPSLVGRELSPDEVITLLRTE